ncbi:MAG: hypothetical protein A2W94_09290 [Bacteroidetes bacterium GWE2_42_42]|nr:MAG: hypothetical protein A2W94_09290 [Bacteroidetes bacterium GWE2_42_42]
MRYAADENTTDCEDPDLPLEGVHLQYSLPPYSSWNDIQYWTPSSSASGPLYTWNQYQMAVPSVAFSSATKIRWYQDTTSTNYYDHWGVDEVQIVCPQSQNIFWSNGPTNTLTQTVTPTDTTEYIIFIFDSLGNYFTDTLNVNVIPTPSADFVAESPVCINYPSTINFTGTNSATVTYAYNFNGGTVVSGSGSGPYEVTWPTAGTYTITLTSTDGFCTNTETQTVTVNSNIIVTVSSPNASVCPDSSVTLTASGGATYAWASDPTLNSDSTASVIATPETTTTYVVTGTSTLGCTGSSSVTIDIFPTPAITVSPVPEKGCIPLVVDFNPSITPNANAYEWNFGDPASGAQNTSNADSPIHVFSNSGQYDISLNVVSVHGCPGSIVFPGLITAYDVPLAAFKPDSTTLNLMNPMVGFTDMSTGASNWYWDFGEPSSYTNYSNLPNPSHSYGATGEYIVWMVVDNGFCADSAYTIISVFQDIAFYVPNAFSPYNEDGLNDIFVPSGIGAGMGDNTFTMRIYDRWGKIMFESSDFYTGWDGKYNGDFAHPGVYTYFIEVQYADKLWRKFWGRVTLVK